MPYEWRGSGSLRRPDEQIQPGETFDPSDAERSAFGDLMVEVEAADDDATPGVEADETGSQETDVCTETVQSTGEECGRERPCPYHD